MKLHLLHQWCALNDCYAVIDGDKMVANIYWEVNDEFLRWVDLEEEPNNA